MSDYNPTARYDVELRDVEYRNAGGPLLARVTRPRGGGVFPALIDVHGGAWSNGSREMDAEFHHNLAATGLVVVSVDFRLAPAHPYPAQVEDVNYATRWLKTRAAELGADASRLGGIGSSSGGHTVLLSAMRPEDPRYLGTESAGAVDASLAYAILRWPVLDPYARYLYARTAMPRLVAATEGYFLTEAAMKEGNPTLILERGEYTPRLPLLIVQGTADENIPMSIPERFVAAWRRAGGEVDLELFEGMPHVFMWKKNEQSDRALEVIERFIARQLSPVASA